MDAPETNPPGDPELSTLRLRSAHIRGPSVIEASPDPETAAFQDRYELGDVLGGGGSAEVYRALDRRTGRDVAVKIARQTDNPAPGAERRAAAAQRAVDQLGRHPGLVEVLDTGRVRGHAYTVLELVEGSSLADLIAAGPLPVRTVVSIGLQLAECLAHVHGRQVVHRDIKPANVLVEQGGRAYLTDFGVSRAFDSTRVTASGVGVGTPAYMAPEQVRGDTVGPAADVYSLGLVMIEALTGRREFTGGLVESAVARLHRQPEVPAALPADLRSVIRAMTRIHAGSRPSAAAVAERLRGASAGDTTEVDERPQARSRPVVAVAAAATVAIALAAATFATTSAPGAATATPEAPGTSSPAAPPAAQSPAPVTAPVDQPVPDVDVAGTSTTGGRAAVAARGDRGGAGPRAEPRAEPPRSAPRATAPDPPAKGKNAGKGRGSGQTKEKPGKAHGKGNGR